VLAGLLGTDTGSAESADDLAALQRELAAVKETLSAIQTQLREIREQLQTLLLARPAAPARPPSPTVVGIQGAPAQGGPTARVTIVEFSDYQCPFCRQHFQQTLPQLEREYIQAGQVQYVFRDFPIEAIHPQAVKAAEAAHCAGDQGKFWPMHDRLFARDAALGPADLVEHGKAIGVDGPAFETCLQSGAHAARVRQSFAEGVQLGISATPTFIIGLTDPAGSGVTAVTVIRGAQPYANFKQAIDGLLAPGR
jgi:protein-disulfide isomerase